MSQERAQTKDSQSSNDATSQSCLSQPAHSLSFEAVIRELGTNSDDGLTSAEVKERLEKYGQNILEGDEGVSIAKIFIRQVANAMMLVSDSDTSPSEETETQSRSNQLTICFP
jgi:Na+-exporting ATPase